jgi:hypothetical protein
LNTVRVDVGEGSRLHRAEWGHGDVVLRAEERVRAGIGAVLPGADDELKPAVLHVGVGNTDVAELFEVGPMDPGHIFWWHAGHVHVQDVRALDTIYQPSRSRDCEIGRGVPVPRL